MSADEGWNGSKQAAPEADGILQWLLEGDVSVRYLTRRWLMDEDDPALRNGSPGSFGRAAGLPKPQRALDLHFYQRNGPARTTSC